MLRIGIDLDNTIIDYDHAFLTAAHQRGLLPQGFTGGKQQVRDHIRTLPHGETRWQELQGYVYGQGIHHAAIFPGVIDAVTHWLSAGHELFIVSHKTEYGHFDETRTNLREAALAFLEAQDFFAHGFKRAHVSFHATRAEKVDKIRDLSLHWFIDDLIEVYEERHFPTATKKILFHSSDSPPPLGDWRACRHWRDIVSMFHHEQ